MPVTKKPTLKNPNNFINQAKVDKKKQEDVKIIDQGNKQEKSKKMTVYMTMETYLKWKEYELNQLKMGKKITFQGTIETYLKKLLK